MDPNFMKFLEEEEDETMHSGADVEAFTAELNRDIEGNASAPQQTSAADTALPQGDNQTTSQFPTQWQTSGHDVIPNFQTGQDFIETEGKEPLLSQLDVQQHDAEFESRKVVNMSSNDSTALPHNPSSDDGQKPQDDLNSFPVSQPMNVQTTGEPPPDLQGQDQKPNPEREAQLHIAQNISDHPSVEMGANDQQPMSMDFKYQPSLSTVKGTEQAISTGISSEPIVSSSNQHTAGMGMSSQAVMTSGISSQQAVTSGMSNQQAMTSGMSSQQAITLSMNSQQAMTLGMNSQQAMTSGMSSQQAMTSGMSSQATTSSMSNQLPMTIGNQQSSAAMKLNKQVPFGMLLPIIQPQLDKDRAMQLNTLYHKLKKNEISKDGFVKHMRSIVGDQMLKMAVFKLQTQARNSQVGPNQFQPQAQTSARQHVLSAQTPTELGNLVNDSSMSKSHEFENQADSQGMHMSHMSTSSSGALTQDRKHPFPAQGLNKQQPMHFSQSSFPAYGSSGSSYPPFSAAHDSQMRQVPAQQNMPVSHMGPTTQGMSMMNISKFERPNTLSDPKKMQAGNAALQQNQVHWPTAVKEQKIGISSSMSHVKQEPMDQSNEQHKVQMSSPHGLSSLSSATFKQGNTAAGNLKDDAFEMHTSRTGFTTPGSLMATNSISTPISSAMETNILSSTRMPSLTAPTGPGSNSKVPQKKPLAGHKKPNDPVSSPPSSKKQKVSGAFLDQSIEHLNDVTAVSGVNLREEEEQLLSGSKEDSRVSEASRRVVQEEEERLILHKIPLQKKVLEIMAKCGLKNMSNDVEKCLSLCVEERLRGLIANLIRLSKQRVDMEKPRHRTIVTSDVRQQIMAINRKAREEWDKKQAETGKSQKLNESDGAIGVGGDKDKDEARAKSKANKEEDDKMRTTAANVAVRAATGVGDMMSKWQLMIEAKAKQGGADTSSASQPSKDQPRKPSANSTKNTKENQESEKRESSSAFNNPASVRKVGRNQVVVPRVARSISVKDVIAILEREPQMSKSTLLYSLYNKVSADATGGE